MRPFAVTLALTACWVVLARASSVTTSGTYTGTYGNTTVCKYHYGSTSIPASAVPTSRYYNSTTGFAQSTKSITKTTYFTPTPQKTTTLTKTTTSTSFTATSYATFTSTRTVTSYTGSTITIPTSKGFTPIGATALSPIPRTTSASTSSSAKIARRGQSTPPGPTSPTGTNTFTTALYCTTNVVFKPTNTATVTVRTKTITRGVKTTTKTITTTVSAVDVAGVYLTATATATAQASYYQACAPNNIADKLMTYNGTIEPINFFNGWYDLFNQPDAPTPYDCCVACQQNPGCLGSSWTDQSQTYGTYEGYFGYSGVLCQLWISKYTCPSHPQAPQYGYDPTRGSRVGAVQLSNGNCNPEGWVKIRERYPDCTEYSEDILCSRPQYYAYIGP